MLFSIWRRERGRLKRLQGATAILKVNHCLPKKLGGDLFTSEASMLLQIIILDCNLKQKHDQREKVLLDTLAFTLCYNFMQCRSVIMVLTNLTTLTETHKP